MIPFVLLQVHIQTIGILVAEKTELQSSLNQNQKLAEARHCKELTVVFVILLIVSLSIVIARCHQLIIVATCQCRHVFLFCFVVLFLVITSVNTI